MGKVRSKIYRDHVIQHQFKDILIPVLFNRNVYINTSYLKFMVDNISKEVINLQPKTLKKTKILGDFTSGIWIKTGYPLVDNPDYLDSNTNIEIKGHVRYRDITYSIFAQIVFPTGYYKSEGKIKPVSSIISEDIKKLLDSFNAKLIKVDGMSYIYITFKNTDEAMNTTKDVIYEVYSEDESFIPVDLPAGSQDIIFESGWIKFGSVSDHDPILDSDRLVRSDKVREIVVLEQDKYDDLVNKNSTKENELYHIIEEYIENPTLPPTEQPTPDRVSLGVKFNDSFIWSKDYDINSSVNKDDINLPPISGYVFEKFKTKPLDDPTSQDVVFPLILTESMVIYGQYKEVSKVKCRVWENSSKILEEEKQTGDEWDPRSRMPKRDKYYYKLYNESSFDNLSEFPILVMNDDIDIYSQWTYGYYFPTKDDFENRIDGIISDNNGDLGDFTFEFGDEIDILDYLFYQKPITSTPKIIISKAKSCKYTFSECPQLTEISDTVYGKCPNLINFEGSFKNSKNISGKVPDLWNRFGDAVGEECFRGCTKAENYPEVPLDWGGVLYHTIKVLNYLDDTLVRELKLLDKTTYDFMTISETYDNTGVWGAYFTDKARDNRIYDPIQITESKTYYAEFDKFDYYFPTVADFKSRIQSIITENNGDLSNKSLGFAPSVHTISEQLTVTNLKKLPKYIWANIDKNNTSKVFGLRWDSDTLNTIPETYFYFMTRMKAINGMFKSKYTENGTTNLIPNKLLEHQKHLLSIDNLFELNIDVPIKKTLKDIDVPETGIVGVPFEVQLIYENTEVDIGDVVDVSKMVIPENFLSNNIELNHIDGLFKGVPAETIPVGLFRSNTSLQEVKSAFSNNKKLSTIPGTLFDPLTGLKDLSYTFANCTNVTGTAPELWNRDPKIPTGTDCFLECRKLDNFFDIPKEWGGDPPTEKEVIVHYHSNISGGFISGEDVVEDKPADLDVTIIAQLSDNKAVLPKIVSNYGKSKFLGWSTSKENKDSLYQSGDDIIISGTEITLHAWYEKTLTVTYNANVNGSFGEEATKTQTVTKNPNIDNTMVLKVDGLTPNAGFQFKEWNTQSNGAGTGYSSSATINNIGELDNFTLYAIYNDSRQSVTFKADTNITVSGQSPAQEVTVRLPKPFIVPTISVANKVVNSNQCTYDFFAQNANGSTPEAKFKQGSTIPDSISQVHAWYKLESMKLILNANYTDGSNSECLWSDIYSNNDSTTNRQISFVPSRSHYIFKGWATSQSGPVAYQSNVNITDVLNKFKNNQTLYAIWEGESVTVNYNLNGGKIDGQTTLTVQAKIGDTINIVNKTPIKDGYKFTNFSDKTGKTYNPGESFTVTPEKLS